MMMFTRSRESGENTCVVLAQLVSPLGGFRHEPQMIEDVCERVAAWAEQNGGQDQDEVKVVDRPLADEQGPAIVTWLFAIRPGPTMQDDGRPAYRAGCRFLVTAVAASAESCHRWVGTLLTAAMRHPTFEVEPGEPPLALWAAAGLAPRPAFVLRGEAVAHADRPTLPRVRVPLTVEHATLEAMTGRVLGPGDVPIAGAEVRLVQTGMRTRTDRDGRFQLKSVPAGYAPKLEVRAGAETYAVTAERTGRDEPLTIHLQAKEA